MMDVPGIVDEIVEFLIDKLDVPFLDDDQERLLFSFILSLLLSFLTLRATKQKPTRSV